MPLKILPIDEGPKGNSRSRLWILFRAFRLTPSWLTGKDIGIFLGIKIWSDQGRYSQTSIGKISSIGKGEVSLTWTGKFFKGFPDDNKFSVSEKSNNAFPLALVYNRLGKSAEARRWNDYGLQAMKRAKPKPSSVVGWSAGHWLSVNVWHREAASALGEILLEAPHPESIDEAIRPQIPDTEETGPDRESVEQQPSVLGP